LLGEALRLVGGERIVEVRANSPLGLCVAECVTACALRLRVEEELLPVACVAVRDATDRAAARRGERDEEDCER
jgi:hypothetical protein